MFFSNLVMYFIILSTGSTLYRAGERDITTAAQAAEALKPLAGDAAGLLFTLGVIGVGFLAVPVMTTGAAYDLAQTMGWRHGLHAKPADSKKFLGAALGIIGADLSRLDKVSLCPEDRCRATWRTAHA